MGNDSNTLGVVRSTGQTEKTFPVSMGPRFLELFSENLYSSPNRAFEELVANSWDAEATAAYISIPENLRDPRAAIWVLDNGVSMDGAMDQAVEWWDEMEDEGAAGATWSSISRRTSHGSWRTGGASSRC